ncbi:hypothetical protein [Streptomyces sp. E2N166]|uniref:hypothetical protein n=1 Tax=Streptomyces sp. E2N166 TaxID=1851909 RepID=UPI001EE8B8D8|nr:hypothetical protein [Streptomyces sp. E2N166]
MYDADAYLDDAAAMDDDVLHTVLRRRAGGESVEQIQPDLIIPTGQREGQTPSVASLYRALAEHAKREAYPEAVEAAPRQPGDAHRAHRLGRPPHPIPHKPDRPSGSPAQKVPPT